MVLKVNKRKDGSIKRYLIRIKQYIETVKVQDIVNESIKPEVIRFIFGAMLANNFHRRKKR